MFQTLHLGPRMAKVQQLHVLVAGIVTGFVVLTAILIETQFTL